MEFVVVVGDELAKERMVAADTGVDSCDPLPTDKEIGNPVFVVLARLLANHFFTLKFKRNVRYYGNSNSRTQSKEEKFRVQRSMIFLLNLEF